MLAYQKVKMTDKMVDISVKNLARVHARNKELQTRVNELEAKNFDLEMQLVRRRMAEPVKTSHVIIEER